jgi:hypothetical protein
VAAGLLLGVQLVLMDHFLASVSKRALWYSGFGVPLFVAGMMVSAFALRVQGLRHEGVWLGQHCAPGAGAGGAGRRGGADHLYAEPRDGRGAGAAGAAAGRAGGAALPGADGASAHGHGSDVGGRRTPWIVGGMGVLAAGGLLAALATGLDGQQPQAGIALAVLAFALVGLGVSASGTSLLVLLAKRVPEAAAPAPPHWSG